jgi:hypothetical protein
MAAGHAKSIHEPSPLPVDYGYWDDEIRRAVEEPDPALSNRQVTRVHFRLSRALGDLLGEGAGANFHTWAVWGSRKAGVTIRQEDLGRSVREGAIVAGIVGTLVAAAGGMLLARRGHRVTAAHWAIGLGAGLACGALSGWGMAVDSRSRASRLILEGNRIVLEDIGRQTARFIAHFSGETTGDPRHLEAFLAELRPGLTESGGQDMLRRAFEQYHLARYATDVKVRQEAAYFANCLAVYHEHIRLQPFIQGSLPHIIRKCVTKRMMTYDVGNLRFSISEDVPALNGLCFPTQLERLENEDLVLFLAGPEGWNVSLDSLNDTAATDWTQIRQRMAYVFALFRALHTDPSIFRHPYPEELKEESKETHELE